MLVTLNIMSTSLIVVLPTFVTFYIRETVPSEEQNFNFIVLSIREDSRLEEKCRTLLCTTKWMNGLHVYQLCSQHYTARQSQHQYRTVFCP